MKYEKVILSILATGLLITGIATGYTQIKSSKSISAPIKQDSIPYEVIEDMKQMPTDVKNQYLKFKQQPSIYTSRDKNGNVYVVIHAGKHNTGGYPPRSDKSSSRSGGGRYLLSRNYSSKKHLRHHVSHLTQNRSQNKNPLTDYY